MNIKVDRCVIALSEKVKKGAVVSKMTIYILEYLFMYYLKRVILYIVL